MVYTDVSWKELKKLLEKSFWYKGISQKWSHMKIRYIDWSIIIIPDHKHIKEWLFNAILSQVWEKIMKSKLEIFMDLFKK